MPHIALINKAELAFWEQAFCAAFGGHFASESEASAWSHVSEPAHRAASAADYAVEERRERAKGLTA